MKGKLIDHLLESMAIALLVIVFAAMPMARADEGGDGGLPCSDPSCNIGCKYAPASGCAGGWCSSFCLICDCALVSPLHCNCEDPPPSP
jgi:hypothetical protein